MKIKLLTTVLSICVSLITIFGAVWVFSNYFATSEETGNAFYGD